jgi:dTDP-4-dehydrorhamnose reductase
MAGLSDRCDLVGVDVEEADITDGDAVLALLEKNHREIVIHAAAYTDVDDSESNQALAMAVNGDGTRNVARACRATGARLIYYSTDYVFDGNKGSPYTEEDSPNPLNAYGRSKLAGERAVREELDDYVILRIAWLYGRHGRDFVKTMLSQGQAQLELHQSGEDAPPLRVVADQVGNPTWTVDVVAQTARIMDGDLRGTYHATAEGEVSWYDLARDVFDTMSMPVRITGCSTEEYLRAAVRPWRSSLENKALNKVGMNVMRDYRQALKEYLEQYARELLI